jgi:hypothetical protein
VYIEEDDTEVEYTFEEALTFLEKLARSFDRDMTPEIRLNIRKNPNLYSLSYDHLPRENRSKETGLALARGNGDAFVDFVEWFQEVANDMMEQYREIRNTRKALFDFDVWERGTSIFVDDGRDEKPLDWEIDLEALYPDSGDD